MDARVIVSAYEELLPRRRGRPISRVAPTAAAAAAARGKTLAPRQQAGGGYSRRELLLAYAQQLRRRRRGGQQQEQRRGPPLLGWGEWKAGRAAAAGDVAVARGGRSWCSRLRSCARLWIRAFFRRASRIREKASCKK